jgi:hypothetical protein
VMEISRCEIDLETKLRGRSRSRDSLEKQRSAGGP